ncbi:hypothetical protein HYR99_22220 [Candidatus Poribacteria bacterium]|nr:hypothetical protein [Candidatus Poribacteria bacterium]
MAFLPQGTTLGKLEPIEVYEFYDQPLLFSCRNASGSIFLAVSIDENDDFETWLYVSMSPNRFRNVRSGAIDLHDAFADAEDGIVYEVRTSYDVAGEVIVRNIPSHGLSPKILPLPGEFLEEQASSEYAVIGILTGAFLSSKRYEIKTQDKTYAGKILDEAFNAVSNATLSERYVATIREVVKKTVTEETFTEYHLVDLDPARGNV